MKHDNDFKTWEKMESTGNFLINKEISLEHTSEILDHLKNIEIISQKTQTPDMIYLNFIMNTVIEDIWSNISADGSYVLSDDNIKDFLLIIGHFFINISKQIKNQDLHNCHEYYIILVNDYLNLIKKFEDNYWENYRKVFKYETR